VFGTIISTIRFYIRRLTNECPGSSRTTAFYRVLRVFFSDNHAFHTTLAYYRTRCNNRLFRTMRVHYWNGFSNPVGYTDEIRVNVPRVYFTYGKYRPGRTTRDNRFRSSLASGNSVNTAGSPCGRPNRHTRTSRPVKRSLERT